MAKALHERRWCDLHAAAEIAHAGIDPELATTDPALFKALRHASTLFFLKGYRCLDMDALSALAEQSA